MSQLNDNPADGEPLYQLGLIRRFQGQLQPAYDAFYKATWNAAWRGPAYMALAEADMAASRWTTALDHLDRSVQTEADNLLALAWRVIVLTRLDRKQETSLTSLLHLDRLAVTPRWLEGHAPTDAQQRLDLAFDLRRAGLNTEAQDVLAAADPSSGDGTALWRASCKLRWLRQMERHTQPSWSTCRSIIASRTGWKSTSCFRT